MRAVFETSARPARNALGAVLLTAAWLFFTAEMVAARILQADLSAAQIGVFRTGTQALLLLPLVLTAPAVLATRRLPMHLMRSACGSGGMILFYLAFALLPLALVTTITFMNAMFMILLAALLLGERIGPRRIGAVVAGFAGVLIAMRPDVGGVEPGAALALAGAFVAALLMIVTRTLAATERRMTIMVYSAWLGLAVLIGPALWSWRAIGPEHWALLALVGLSGTMGQFLMVGAFEVAEASALAPVDYLRLVFAVAAGYAVFGEVPAPSTWIGAAVIVGAVAYATHRERAAARLTERSPE